MRPGAADRRAAQLVADRAAGVGFGSRALALRRAGPTRAAAAAAPRPQPATRRGRAPALRCLRWRPPPGPWRSTSRSWSSTRPQTSNSKVGRGGLRERRAGGGGRARWAPSPAARARPGPARAGARAPPASRRHLAARGRLAAAAASSLARGPGRGPGVGGWPGTRGRLGGRRSGAGAGRALRQRAGGGWTSSAPGDTCAGRHLRGDPGAAGATRAVLLGMLRARGACGARDSSFIPGAPRAQGLGTVRPLQCFRESNRKKWSAKENTLVSVGQVLNSFRSFKMLYSAAMRVVLYKACILQGLQFICEFL